LVAFGDQLLALPTALRGIIDDVLSFCMIAKNEERDLPKCLDSVRHLAGELIVVDTGSTDRTPALAAEYGAEVIPFDFTTVDFAAARNCAIGHARGRWVLMLDADETLDAAGAPAVEKLVAEDRNAGYFLERYNHSTGSESSFTDFVVRLFPNRPGVRYRGRVHETVDGSILAGGGKLIRAAIRIDHRFSPDTDARRQKNHRYIEILKQEIAADPSDDSRLDFLAAEYHQLEMFDEAIEIAERLARIRPHDARAHLFAGVYHLLYRPNLPQARADFEQALRLRPGYPEAESFLRTLDERERAGAILPGVPSGDAS
jgi:glycosyltransferase involved in cell wall biosynthesis